MTITDLLCYLRNQLVEANLKHDTERLQEIFYALTVIDDAAQDAHVTVYASVIDDLRYAWQHLSLADHKVKIPSQAEIRAATIS